ncbi:hypothetical protein B2H97_13335 [Paraclostridium bifermentans]|uniref:hypothetical protein n=1 Tax=Paraclostridium bifermentans TaxID=1490 RepID=UPI000A174727|nr:hypothetical protein [Paraclostridium bifermentans]OSB08936.1 hypothetical protein B2H97_13335 [Paraclostridium bifermentans]
MLNKLEQILEMAQPLEIQYKKMNDIVLESYCEKYSLNKDDIDVNNDCAYKNYKDSSREKLGMIAENLGIDIEEFKESDNKYKIPFNVGEIMVQYLVEDSKKGSFISKIKINELSKITTSEKREFMNIALDRALKSCRDKEDKEYVQILRKDYLKIIEILEKADKKKEYLLNISKKSIDENIKNIYAIDDRDGIVKFGTKKDKKGIEKPKYKNILTSEDSELLVDAYSLILESLNKKWAEIIENYINKKKEYVFENLPEDAEKLVDVELCMLKDALDVTYLEKDDIKNKMSQKQLDNIKKFLMKNSSLEYNRVISTLSTIADNKKNDL